jgi:hypothetical protein
MSHFLVVGPFGMEFEDLQDSIDFKEANDFFEFFLVCSFIMAWCIQIN